MRRRVTSTGSIVIITHTLFYGASEALRDYIHRKQSRTLFYVAHPLLSANTRGSFQVYENGKQTRSTSWTSARAGSPIGYAADFFTTIRLVWGVGHIHTFIGVNPVNAFTGLFLRATGRVDRVIFYAIDFVPVRFGTVVVNYVYHMLESYVVRHADDVWNVSPAIAQARKQFLGIDPSVVHQRVVPIGIWKRDIRARIKQTNNYRIIFAGHLLKKQGVQAVIRAMQQIRAKFPHASLTVIGGGEYEAELKRLVRTLRLSTCVTFTGWIADPAKIHALLCRADVAVATYEDSGKDATNFTYYADPTKIKTYFAQGLPVVLTDVSHNARALARTKAAVLVQYTDSDIAQGLVRLLGNTAELTKAKRKAIELARTMTWECIFDGIYKTI